MRRDGKERVPSLWATPGRLSHDRAPWSQGGLSPGMAALGWGQRVGQVGKGGQPSLPLNIWAS